VTLYDELANDLGESIARGALRPGERMPSVRGLARKRGVSVATVVAAYVRLENDGLVEVRPRSGHFVRRKPAPAEEPRAPRRTTGPAKPSVANAVLAMQASMRDPTVLPLGSAYLAAELLPIAALNRTLAGIAREVQTAGANYDVPPGLLTLRRALARRSVDWGVPLGAEDFITTLGATEAIFLCLSVIAKPGDAIAVESPTYFGVLQAIEALGLRAVEVPCHARTGMDLDALDDVLRAGGVRAVLSVTNVSNPLGAVMPDEAKERLERMLARHDVPLIEDDVYGDLTFDGPRPRPVKAWDRDGRVLLCGSVSKTLAPGYRIGWVSPGRWSDAISLRKHALTLASPTLTQMAVAEFLRSGGYDRHVRRLRRVLAGQTARMLEAVTACFPEGTRVSSPRGGFVLWVELPAAVDALELAHAALAKNIAIAPGPIFSARARFTSCIRLSCGMPWSPKLANAIETLGAMAASRIRRQSSAAGRSPS
jgi:DNA-binding transcriptional MocR family regulator